MFLKEIKIENYKSFREAITLQLGPGMNLIAGQNNSGKTALLEAMQLEIPVKPHKSEATVEIPGRETNDTSTAEALVQVSRNELIAMLQPYEQCHIPAPRLASDFAQRLGYAGDRQEHQSALVRFFLSRETHEFRVRYQNNARHGGQWKLAALPSFGLYEARSAIGQPLNLISFSLEPNGTPKNIGGTSAGQEQNEIGVNIAPRLMRHIYRFGAERFVRAKSNFGNRRDLEQNASNLAEVLSFLQGDSRLFENFNALVRRVLPQINSVSVDNTQEGFEIRVWNSPRRDLTLSLAECGTGIGQVLAVLSVILLAEFPQVILIDEPQSFLHPGAVRKLIEILREDSRHQYIISTHSPSVLSASQPEKILITTLDGSETRVDQIQAKERKHVVFCLAELGARLSDVFGADDILWVEGRTEEICFTEILRRVARKSLLGTSIVGVRKTGDFESKKDDPERIFDIYMDLSESNALVPPAIGFLFDRECRTEAQLEDLVRKGRELVRFLPRRTYENYLLIPEAIAEVLSASDENRRAPITPEQVEGQLKKMLSDSGYYCKGARAGENWEVEINGAEVLKHIFNTLSETRVAYKKPQHSVALTDWIIEHRPKVFDEIVQILAGFLDRPPAKTAAPAVAAGGKPSEER